jgi:hypothetical protein
VYLVAQIQQNLIPFSVPLFTLGYVLNRDRQGRVTLVGETEVSVLPHVLGLSSHWSLVEAATHGVRTMYHGYGLHKVCRLNLNNGYFLLLCGDIEQNPGPPKKGISPKECYRCTNNNCWFNGGKSRCKGNGIPKTQDDSKNRIPKTQDDSKKKDGGADVGRRERRKQRRGSTKGTRQQKRSNLTYNQLLDEVLKNNPNFGNENKDDEKVFVEERQDVERNVGVLSNIVVLKTDNIQNGDIPPPKGPTVEQFIESVYDKFKTKTYYFYPLDTGRSIKSVRTTNRNTVAFGALHWLIHGKFDFNHLKNVAESTVVASLLKVSVWVLKRNGSGGKFPFVFLGLVYLLRKYITVFKRPIKGKMEFQKLTHSRLPDDYRWSAYDNYKLKHNVLFEATIKITLYEQGLISEYTKEDVLKVNYETFLEMIGPATMDPYLTTNEAITKLRVQNRIIQNTNQDKYIVNFGIAKTLIAAQYFVLASKQHQMDHVDFFRGGHQNW